jgi:FkbM family methyltransferase
VTQNSISGTTREHGMKDDRMDEAQAEPCPDGADGRPSQGSFLTLEQTSRSYEILLPDPDDHIQKSILRTGEPYELEMLRDMRMRLAPGDLVLDIGANVGNHTLYLAAVADARVIAFEPNTHLAEGIAASAARNALDGQIEVRAFAVGAAAGHATFARLTPENLGAQALALGAGSIEVMPLDALGIEGPVRALKVDVEGMEIDVLAGAVNLIGRDRPILYVESRDAAAFREVAHFAQEHGYTYWETFNVTPTHLFLPAESVSLDQRLEALKAREVAQEYRLLAQLRRGQRDLAAAKRQIAEGKKTEAELTGVKSELATVKSELAARTAEAARIQTKLLDLETENAELTASVRTRFEELAALTRMLEAVRFTRAQNLQKHAGAKRAAPGTVSDPLAYARDLERRHADLLESATWRAMEPARRIRRWAKGSKPPRPFKPRLLGTESNSPSMDEKALLTYARDLETRHVATLNSTTWRAMEPVRRVLRLLKGRK